MSPVPTRQVLPSPFEIGPDEVEVLSDVELVRLVNRLSQDEGRRLELPPNEVLTTLRIDDPDGGADALTDMGTKVGRFLGTGKVVWQFKRRWPSKTKRIETELGKRAV